MNTRGCVAVISVRERPEEAQVDRPGTVSAVTAAQDGIIERVTVTNGTALCRPGQAVRAGETLISGYTDCGRTIRAGRAEEGLCPYGADIDGAGGRKCPPFRAGGSREAKFSSVSEKIA